MDFQGDETYRSNNQRLFQFGYYNTNLPHFYNMSNKGIWKELYKQQKNLGIINY